MLNSSNAQTVALGCLLLSVIICIFTWCWSWGSKCTQPTTDCIHLQADICVESHWLLLGESLYKAEHQCQAAASDWPGSPGAPPGCQLTPALPDQHTSENGSRHFQPEPSYQGAFLSSSYTQHRMGNTLYSRSGACESGSKASEHTQVRRSIAHKFLSVLCLQQKSGEILLQSSIPLPSEAAEVLHTEIPDTWHWITAMTYIWHVQLKKLCLNTGLCTTFGDRTTGSIHMHSPTWQLVLCLFVCFSGGQNE